jgi:hypothetical protein
VVSARGAVEVGVRIDVHDGATISDVAVIRTTTLNDCELVMTDCHSADPSLPATHRGDDQIEGSRSLLFVLRPY